MSIPNGIQPLVLWQMDGRTWIEPMVRAESKLFQVAISRGWATIIPARLAEEFIQKVKEYDGLH